MREGLDEESLPIIDLLKKPDLSAAKIKRIEAVAVELLERLKTEMLRTDHWRDKEATRDAARVTIRDFLWDDATGLPVDAFADADADADADVDAKAEDVFRHGYRGYPTPPSTYFSEAAR